MTRTHQQENNGREKPQEVSERRRDHQEEKLERERARVGLEIKNKFASKAWLGSPYRDLDYACQRYTLQVFDKKTKKSFGHQSIWQTVRDIINTLERRAARARTDPAASWDYVTNTLSDDEMRKVAFRLVRTKIDNDYLD